MEHGAGDGPSTSQRRSRVQGILGSTAGYTRKQAKHLLGTHSRPRLAHAPHSNPPIHFLLRSKSYVLPSHDSIPLSHCASSGERIAHKLAWVRALSLVAGCASRFAALHICLAHLRPRPALKRIKGEVVASR